MNNGIIAQRIKEVMGDLTQADFASQVNSTQTTISKVLAGAMPSSSLLTSIAKQFGVSVDWILGLSDNKYVSGASTETLLYSDVFLFSPDFWPEVPYHIARKQRRRMLSFQRMGM